MPRVSFVLFVSIVVVAIVFAASISEAAKVEVKAGLIRNAWEKGPGEFLPDMLKRVKVKFVDLTEKFRAGEYAFGNINVLIIETNAMNDPLIAGFFAGEEMKKQVEAFVSNGGIIIQFPQPVSKETELTWLPGDRYTKRVEVSNLVVHIDEKGRDYRLFREVSTRLVDKKLFLHSNYGLSPVNGFSGWRAFYAPAFADMNKDTASILESDFARGRVILFTIPFDNLPGENLPSQKVAGMRLLIKNLAGHCEEILNGTAIVKEHTPSVISKVVKVYGFVFEDANRNGIRDKGERGVANALVSNSHTVEKTNSSGAYTLTMEQHRTPFLTVCAPAGYWSLNNRFYFKPNYETGASDEQKIDISLIPAPAMKTPNVFFIHCNDMLIRDEASAYNFLEDVKELNAYENQYGFVALTGNLISRDPQNPTPRKEYELATKILKNLRLYMVTAVGNYDWSNEPAKYADYEEFRGPRHYSFQYGNYHFFVLDSWSMPPEVNEWFKKESEIVKKEFKKNIIVFQQAPLTEKSVEFFAENGVSAIFCGQIFSNREIIKKLTESTFPPVLEFGTSSFSFPGLDRTPRGFRLVSASDSGIQTVFRLGGIKQNLKITYPQPDAKISRGYVPLIVNAYDTGYFVNRINYRISAKGSNVVLFEGNLRKYSDWMWALDKPLAIGREVPENCTISIKAYDSGNQVWNAEGDFSFSNSVFNPVSVGEDWAQFKKDELHAGHTSGTLKPPLNLAWAAHTGGITNYSSPVTSGGLVFVGTQYFNSMKGNSVAAFDAVSGNIRWRFQADSPIKHTVAVKDGIVVAQSAEGIVYALNAGTGKQIWRYDIKKTSIFPLTNPVAIDKNQVYVGDDAKFTVLRLKDGDYEWDFNIDHNYGISIADAPAIWEDVVIVPFRHGTVKLARDSGRQEMLREFNPQPESGVEVPRIPLHRTPVISENIMYSSYYPHESRLCAYDLDKNQFLWISQLVVSRGPYEELSSPAVADGVVVVGTAKGEVAGVEAETGKIIWKSQSGKNIASFVPGIRLESSITSSPAICNGIAYIGSNDGVLYAFDIKTGDIVWKFDIGCPVTGSPAISGNTLFVTAYDGTLYAFTAQ